MSDINVDTLDHKAQIAAILGAKKGKDIPDFGVKKDALASQHYYLRIPEYDADFEEEIGATCVNVEERLDDLLTYVNQEKIQAGFNELHMVKYRIDNNLNASSYVLHRYGSLQKQLEENMK